MKELSLVVTDEGETPTTTSLLVAEKFDRRHKQVLSIISEIIGELELDKKSTGHFFCPVDYLDNKGEKRPMYHLTEEGFALVAFRFTGANARKWQREYIYAFSQMKQVIQESRQEQLSKDIDLIELTEEMSRLEKINVRYENLRRKKIGNAVARGGLVMERHNELMGWVDRGWLDVTQVQVPQYKYKITVDGRTELELIGGCIYKRREGVEIGDDGGVRVDGGGRVLGFSPWVRRV